MMLGLLEGLLIWAYASLELPGGCLLIVLGMHQPVASWKGSIL